MVSKKEPEMPETIGCEILVEYMLKIGPGLNYGMGMVPLSFHEILSWASLMGILLSPFEANAIRDLSRAYVGQLNISKDSNCPPPWVKGVDDIETYNLLNKMAEIAEETKPNKALSRARNRKGK